MKSNKEATQIMQFLYDYCNENDLKISGSQINKYDVSGTYPGKYVNSKVEIKIEFDCEKWRNGMSNKDIVEFTDNGDDVMVQIDVEDLITLMEAIRKRVDERGFRVIYSKVMAFLSWEDSEKLEKEYNEYRSNF